jgi:hypothetical protein
MKLKDVIATAAFTVIAGAALALAHGASHRNQPRSDLPRLIMPDQYAKMVLSEPLSAHSCFEDGSRQLYHCDPFLTHFERC